MLKFMHSFEKGVALTVAIILGVVIVLSTANEVIIIAQSIIKNPHFLFDINELLPTLGTLITIIIAVEVFHTIITFSEEYAMRIETVLLVAMIAIARDVIILNVYELGEKALVGIAALVIALSLSYYLIKRSLKKRHQKEKEHMEA